MKLKKKHFHVSKDTMTVEEVANLCKKFNSKVKNNQKQMIKFQILVILI